MRLIYFGSSPFGLPTLEALRDRHTLCAIVTQPPRPAGRARRLADTPVAAWAKKNACDVPLLAPDRINEPGIIDRLRRFEADAWVVIAYGQKLSKPLLDGINAINLHASLLPRWRGAAPIHASILAGDTQTGNSIITLADRMDSGLILASSPTPIGPADTTGDLHDRLAAQGPTLVQSVLEMIAADALSPLIQDESLVTHASKLSRADRWVDLCQPADICRRRINGLSPKPGVCVAWRQGQLKLLRAQVALVTTQQLEDQAIGQIIDPSLGLIVCGRGTLLQLLDVQAPGSRAMPWIDFARGQRVQSGEVLHGATAC